MQADVSINPHCSTRLSRPTTELPTLKATEILFSCTINLCEERIHSRLQSTHWRRPFYRVGRVDDSVEPLHLALRRLSDSHRAFLSNHSARSRTFLQDLDELCNLYGAIDDHSDNGEGKQTKLKQALQQSHALSTSNGACTLETTIADCGLNPESICQNKHIRQVCKLGRYWGFCLDTPNDARRYRKLFRTVTITYSHMSQQDPPFSIRRDPPSNATCTRRSSFFSTTTIP